MKIALEPNLTRESAEAVTLKICSELDELGAEYVLNEKYRDVFSSTKAEFPGEKEMLSGCDVLIAVGGDGTIISSAKKASEHGIPVLGVNAGRIAFMAGLEAEEIYKLSNILKGEYKVDRRMMLEASTSFDQRKFYCINDAFVGRAGQINMAQLEVLCDRKLVNNYFADGVIVSTPTGSTAYSLSAGGPVIQPDIESIMVTPVCAHSLFSRPIIFRPDSEIEIFNRNRDGEEVYLSCDGCDGLLIPKDEKVIVRKTDKTADFITIKSDTFVDTLNCKLSQWRA